MPDHDTQSGRRSANRSRSRLLPCLVGGVWVLSLATLAFVTANPVTLNREQILDSRTIVSATVDDPATGACTVVDVWRGPGEPGRQITVQGLPAGQIQPGRTYLLPLELQRGEKYRIVPAKSVPGKPGLIYPATPHAVAQLEAICSR